MNLNVTERFLLMSILPREGNIIDMNNAQNIKSVAQFSPEELDKLKPATTETGMRWDVEGAIEVGEKDVVVGVSGAELIKKTLKKLSDEEKLPMDCISLYRKFVDADLVVRDEAGKIVRDVVPEVISAEELKARIEEPTRQPLREPPE